MKVGEELIIRIRPNSQEKYLKELESFTTEELLWVIAFRQRELNDKVDASYDACNNDKLSESHIATVILSRLDGEIEKIKDKPDSTLWNKYWMLKELDRIREVISHPKISET